MSLQPSRLRLKHHIRGNHTLIPSGSCDTKIFLRILKIALRHCEFLQSLAFLLAELCHLKRNHLLRIIEPILRESRFSLRLLGLLDGLGAVENRHIHQHTRREETSELVLETIEHIRIGHRIICHHRHCRKPVGTHHSNLLVINLLRQIEASDFRPCGINLLVTDYRAHLRHRNRIESLVRESNFTVKRKTALLAQKHLRKSKSVGCLRIEHLGLVHLHLNRERIRRSRKTLSYESIHILSHLTEKVRIVLCKILLCRDGDNLPVGLFDVGENLRMFSVILRLHQFLGILCHLVGSHNLAAHKHRLLDRNHRAAQIVHIKRKRVGDMLSYRVDRGRDVRRLKAVYQFLEGSIGHILRHHVLVRHNLHHLVSHVVLESGPGILNHGGLVVVDEFPVAARVHISASCRNLREIVREGNISVIPCNLDFLLSRLQRIVVFYRHLPALVKSQNLLRTGISREHTECCGDNPHCLFHFSISLNYFPDIASNWQKIRIECGGL